MKDWGFFVKSFMCVSLLVLDVNECEQMQLNRCEWKCVNLPGTHRCICPRGYTLHPNGYQCEGQHTIHTNVFDFQGIDRMHTVLCDIDIETHFRSMHAMIYVYSIRKRDVCWYLDKWSLAVKGFFPLIPVRY